MYDVSIASRLRAAGLTVVEVDGWRDRGRTSLPQFDPKGSVNHHTAGPSTGETPSLEGIIFGFSGSAPPPLANILQSRASDGNDTFYVIAAGKANHAGEGGWAGLSGNNSVFGLEIEHDGRSPLPEYRQRLAARCHAALAEGRWLEQFVCQHFEWAPLRKIDAATGVDPNRFRQYVREYLLGQQPDPIPPTPEVDDMWALNATLKPGEDAQFSIPAEAKTLYVRATATGGETQEKPGTFVTAYFSRSDQKSLTVWSQAKIFLNKDQTIQQQLDPKTARAVGLRNDGTGILAVGVSGQ